MPKSKCIRFLVSTTFYIEEFSNAETLDEAIDEVKIEVKTKLNQLFYKNDLSIVDLNIDYADHISYT